MSAGRKTLWAGLLLAVFVLVGFVGWVAYDAYSSGGEAVASTTSSPSPSASPSIPYNEDAMAAKTENQVVVRNYLVKLGWKAEQLNFGELKQHTEDRGASSFTDEAVLTSDELVSFLNAPTKQSAAVRRNLKAYLNAQGYGAAEYRRMLKGDGWVRVQFLDAFRWEGMTYYAGGRMVVSYSKRPVMKGDAGWFYVTSGDKPLEGRTVVRSDCGNPALAPKPAPPGFKPPTKPEPLHPKKPAAFPKEPKPPADDNGSGGGGCDDGVIPPRPSEPDPTPCDTQDVNPPARPDNPDSGDGATDTVTPPPDAPDPDDAAPPPDPGTPPPTGDPGMP